MDFGIVNPSASVMYDDIPAKLRETLEDVIFNRGEKQDLLVEMAQKIAAEGKGKTAVADTQKWREDSVEKRLQHALINGVNNGLFIPLGFLFIIPSSLCSNDKQILGIESVTKSINKI